MRGVIYARYSCDKQREESIEGQLRECRQFAKSQGIDVINEYIDRAYSATTDQRPAFQRMISDSYLSRFDAVIVWKSDRFSRNRRQAISYRDILKENNVKLLSATEPNIEGPAGILFEAMNDGYNELMARRTELEHSLDEEKRKNPVMDIEDIKLLLSKCRGTMPENESEKKMLVDLLIKSIVIHANGDIDIFYNFRENKPCIHPPLLSSTTKLGWCTSKQVRPGSSRPFCDS